MHTRIREILFSTFPFQVFENTFADITWTCASRKITVLDWTVLWTRANRIVFLSEAEKARIGPGHIVGVFVATVRADTDVVVAAKVSQCLQVLEKFVTN